MNKLLVILTLAASAAASTTITAAARPAGPNVTDIKHTITDDAIIYPESFEADTQKMMESWYLKNYTATDDRYKSMPDPDVSDEVIKNRLAALPVSIEMPYNKIVRNYIDRYTKRGRAQVAALLGLSIYYMPIFEQALEEEGIPLELKYLPVIESALDPNAVSRHAATGLWQFMLATAKGVGLEVNTLVDERRDPYASSRHAARYLHDLYDTYGDWSLAIAAYNCGPGSVNKAIRRAGGDPKSHDFWSIYNYLTPETRGYVPMFIAANYVMTYYPEHNISPVLPTKPLVTDTVHVSRRVHFDQISKVLSIPVEELRILNPQFRADIVPGSPSRPFTLILPSQQALAYVMSEDNIVAYEADRYTPRTEVEPGDPEADVAEAAADDGEESDAGSTGSADNESGTLLASHPDDAEPAEQSGREPRQESFAAGAATRTVTHTVAAGETLGDIADKYQVRVADIRSWNSLRRNAVRTGQKLRIQTALADENIPQAKADTRKTEAQPAREKARSSESASTRNKQQTKQTKQQAKPRTTSHEIKSGENLTTIAKKYGVSVEELRKANGMSGDNIRAGQTLKVPSKGGASKSGKSGKSGKRKSKKKSRRR